MSKHAFRETVYDFIFLGAGCASLSLLMRMLQSGKFNDKKILLLDKEAKTKNDRTWCFWEQQDGFFDPIVYKKWDHISFLSNDYSSSMNIAPYQYKMIRGIDFYEYCFEKIKKHDNVEIVYGNASIHSESNDGVIINFENEQIKPGRAIVFNSIYTPQSGRKKHIQLLQHFKGWIIETSKPTFNPEEATMMDFRVGQENGTTFAYVLPFTTTSALIEYTLFTKELLRPEQYEAALRDYIKNFLGIDEYDIKEKEFGVIPMTNEKFQFSGQGVYHIGTAGGQTKASSGYTFQFIQKQSQKIVDCLTAGKPLNTINGEAWRFSFYDNTLLHILYHNKLPGSKIFSRLFKKNKPQQVLRFLDNESSVKDELKIISSLPKLPFLKAAFKVL